MEVHPNSAQAYDLFHKGILALAKAERQGFRVDTQYVASKKKHLTRKIDRLTKNFYESDFCVKWQKSSTKKININSGDQLADYLYRVKGITPKKLTKTGKGSTDDEALGLLNIPELKDLLDIKRLKKARDTYLDAFEREQVDGYVHPFFNLHIPVTYRSSSQNPNFQNIPKRDKEIMRICRKALFPRIGNQLMEIDFSGLEVCIGACYHKDPQMIKYITDPSTDMHRDMTQQIFLLDSFDKNESTHSFLRSAIKNGFVFPEFYGDYYKSCAEYLCTNWGKLPQSKWKPGQGVDFEGGKLSDHLISKGLTSYQKFENHLKVIEDDFWNNRFFAYKKWKDRLWIKYQKQGYVDLKTGFRCKGVMKKNDVTNYPVQGAAFHCLLWSLIEVTESLSQMGMKTKVIGQIHDSIILDVNPKELEAVKNLVKYITTDALLKAFDWICVPLKVEAEICPINSSWAEKEPCVL